MVSLSNHLESNLKALSKCQPALAEELGRQPAARRLQLLPLNGDIPDVDAILLLGLPTADSWPQLVATKTQFLIVAHNDLPEIKAYLGIVDLQDPLARGRISFAVGDDGVLQVLNDLFGTLYRRKIVMFGTEGTPAYEEALREMRFFDTLCASNRATLDKFAGEWQGHLSGNLKDFLRGPFLQDEHGAWKNGDAVVVAAGPSVDDVDIPAAFGGAHVVACDTAVPILAGRGITPELIVTLDSSVSNQTYLKDLPSEIYEKSILCVTPLVSRVVYQAFRRVLFYSYGHPTLDYLRECGLPFEPMATGGSVALTAIDVMRILEVKNTFLLGYDFQYYPFRTHARGTGTTLRAMASTNRFRTVESSVYEYQHDLETPTAVKHQNPENAQSALMDKKFKKWRDWLELYVKNNDINLYRLSEHSPPFRNIQVGKPSDRRLDQPLAMRPGSFNPGVQRELKFLAKETEMAMAARKTEILQRVFALPRVAKCLGYVLAWLADKPQDMVDDQLWQAVQGLHQGLTDALSSAGNTHSRQIQGR